MRVQPEISELRSPRRAEEPALILPGRKQDSKTRRGEARRGRPGQGRTGQHRESREGFQVAGRSAGRGIRVTVVSSCWWEEGTGTGNEPASERARSQSWFRSTLEVGIVFLSPEHAPNSGGKSAHLRWQSVACRCSRCCAGREGKLQSKSQSHSPQPSHPL